MFGIGNISKSVNLFNVPVEGQGNVLRHLSGQAVSIRPVVSALVRYLGNYRLDNVSPFIIERFRIDCKEKDEVGEGMINNCVATLSHLFSMAIQAGVIAKNPCKNVKRFKSAQTKDRVLSESEINLLLNLPQSKDRMMILTGLFTGMRLIEVLSLKWSNIDFARSLISFTQNKTGKAIVLPLSSYLASELMGYRAICTTGDSVFEAREITKGVTDKYSGYFSALFKSLGIHNVTYHTLRHSFSSLLQSELGIGAVVVQGMTGHSSLSMLQRYSHTGLDSKQRAIQSLTDHILSIKNSGNNTRLFQTGTA